MTSFSLDLDAARREAGEPDSLPAIYKGTTFHLPAELPADVFDPFLTPEFGLPAVIAAVYSTDDDSSVGEKVMKILFDQPTLPASTVAAVYRAIELLFGEEQYAEFKKLRPSVKDYVRLVRGLFDLYGTSLGEAFASGSDSTSGGPTSSPTSPDTTTASTPEASGAAPEPAPAS